MPGAVWFEDTRLNYAENLLAGDGPLDGSSSSTSAAHAAQ